MSESDTHRKLSMRLGSIRSTFAAVIIAGAISAPAAGAKLDLNPPIPPAKVPAIPAVVPAGGATRTPSAGSSFDWGDAGVGAGVALVAVGLRAGAMRTRRRPPQGLVS